ncbi:hypothetical protein LSH36_74g06007 [Paralvinella palmiformis]|uniref:Uncharacterized protein n=1 Tax=Paralvinella palmiformis TaxID=53620 RepID=A0AAD9K2P5_9ANNE|nr:hypothetical protein LSH36_74g06007 [Paralvinella palmiformis]
MSTLYAPEKKFHDKLQLLVYECISYIECDTSFKSSL